MIKNLESTINKVGYNIVKKISKEPKKSDRTKHKNEIDKALGVLSNDGVYAYYVYVKSKKVDDIFLNEISSLMNYTSIKLENDNYQKYFENLSSNLEDLLFFRELLEKILIYARYHAKAVGE